MAAWPLHTHNAVHDICYVFMSCALCSDCVKMLCFSAVQFEMSHD